MKLISDSHLAQIESHLGAILDRLLDADGLGQMRRVIRQYVLAGGKRIRPQLCVWTWEKSGQPAAGGGQRDERSGFTVQGGEGSGSTVQGSVEEIASVRSSTSNTSLTPDPRTLNPPLPPSLLDVSCAWELFHAFLLAHDDIIDSAETRREQAALHRQLASLDHNCPKFGTNLGIVAGDLLFSAAMQLWHDLDVPPNQYRRLLKLFGRVATTTGFGQAIDICQSHAPLDEVHEDTLLREYHWKTAAYTFEGPMLAGAILAGAPDAAIDAISKYALALGQAYQLQNDLIDLSAAAHEGSDIVQGKRTVTLIAARTQMSPQRRREFDAKLEQIQFGESNGRTLELADALRVQLLDSGAASRTHERIEAFLKDARAAAETPGLPASLGEGMAGLLGALRTQYFRAKV